MYQAAIVEDEKPVSEYIRTLLVSSFNKQQLTVAFDLFDNGSALLKMLESHYHYDVIFLDIEMPELDGISVCRQIRSLCPDVLVVFISNKEELVFSTFEVQPFRFIRKSQIESMADSLTLALKNELLSRNRQMIQIIEPLSNDIFSFDVGTIQYVEAQGRKCEIVTAENRTSVACRFKDLETQLLPYRFIKIHRSYLVNAASIFHIQKSTVVLNDNTELPISRGKQEEVKQLFMKYTMS